MRKLIVVVLIIAVLYGCSATTFDPSSLDFLVGMTMEDAQEFISLDERMLAYGYAFATDHNGNPIYLEWEIDEQDQIVFTHVSVFDKRNIDNSPSAIKNLEYGLTISQVVERIGIPSRIPATGMFYLEFTDRFGTAYYLSFSARPGEPHRFGAIVMP